ncbi:MAG: hypothetical protein U9Q07_10245 [Planctomycetota bacterium]|nr:hypothetical protein [Planctomycetota bacterium]
MPSTGRRHRRPERVSRLLDADPVPPAPNQRPKVTRGHLRALRPGRGGRAEPAATFTAPPGPAGLGCPGTAPPATVRTPDPGTEYYLHEFPSGLPIRGNPR